MYYEQPTTDNRDRWRRTVHRMINPRSDSGWRQGKASTDCGGAKSGRDFRLISCWLQTWLNCERGSVDDTSNVSLSLQSSAKFSRPQTCEHMYSKQCCQAHCLNHLYTVKPRPPGAMQLRTRGHQFELPAIKYEFNKQNVIVRSLFNYV